MSKNEYKVLNLIFNDRNITASELSKKLDISNAAISKILKKLKEKNIIEDQSKTIIDGKGRPKKLMKIKKNEKKIVGINFGADFIDISISYLDGEIIESHRKKFFLKRKETLVEILMLELEKCIIKYGGEDIVGIGLALNGLVDTKKNASIYSPYFKWKSFEIGEILEQKFNIPVIVDNDVRAMLNAERHFGNIRKYENVYYLYLKKGIGSAMIINGEIFEGSNNHAGEIGHYIINSSSNIICKCGKKGCFETEYSENVIRFMIQQEYEKISKPNYLDNMDMIDIYKEAANKNKVIENVVANLSIELGKIVGNIMNVLDIENIVVAGDIINAKDVFKKNFELGMRKNISSNFKTNINIEFTKLGEEVEKKGAISLVTKNLFANLKLIK